MEKEKSIPSSHLKGIAEYYSEKVNTFGASPRGVDWNGVESQTERYKQLLSICGGEKSGFSLNDYGCGYGGVLEYMTAQGYGEVNYVGFDISEEMISAAIAKFGSSSAVRFYQGATADEQADYSIASGIFNVKLEAVDESWKKYILSVLDDMDSKSKAGFAFNCLTKYSDKHLMKNYLYYADPCDLFDFCKKEFSRNVALLHDYGLYEFTILVRKDV